MYICSVLSHLLFISQLVFQGDQVLHEDVVLLPPSLTGMATDRENGDDITNDLSPYVQ